MNLTISHLKKSVSEISILSKYGTRNNSNHTNSDMKREEHSRRTNAFICKLADTLTIVVHGPAIPRRAETKQYDWSLDPPITRGVAPRCNNSDVTAVKRAWASSSVKPVYEKESLTL
jgi:hypothetical protein